MTHANTRTHAETWRQRGYACTLPNGQFSFALALVHLGRDDVTCESKVGHFARVVVGDEDVARRQVAMDNLLSHALCLCVCV